MGTADLEDASAASAAVLAGHFMIWAGPATTMHQRKFVPDILTCILIQPLGLMKDAQIALYVFMLLMNCVQYFASRSGHAASRDQHVLVGALTLIFLTMKYVEPVSEPATTTTLTTTTKPLCATEHTNVNAVIGTVLQVSVQAVLCSVVAKVVVSIMRCRVAT